jgi:hypothetical protein
MKAPRVGTRCSPVPRNGAKKENALGQIDFLYGTITALEHYRIAFLFGGANEVFHCSQKFLHQG